MARTGTTKTEVALGASALLFLVLGWTWSDNLFLAYHACIAFITFTWIKGFVLHARASFRDYLIIVGTWLVATALGNFALSHASSGQFRTPTVDGLPDTSALTAADSLYYTITSALTIGYGDIIPLSQKARLIAALNMLVGFAILTVVFGWVAANFKRDSPDPQ